MATFIGVTGGGRGTFEFLMVAPALVAMLVSPSMRQAPAGPAGRKIRVLQETPLSASADVAGAVRDQCRALGKEIPRAIARASRRVTLVETRRELTDEMGRALSVEITQARADHLFIRGALIDGGAAIADFEGDQSSAGPAPTCAGLDKAEAALGAAIARWLEHPKPHSRLPLR